jgi:hypothetical protein
VVHHNLSVMFEHMYLTQASQNMGPLGNPMGGAAPPVATGGMRHAMQPLQAGGNGGPDGQCADAYLALLQQPEFKTGSGLSIDDAVHRLSGQFPEVLVRAVAATLLNDGHVYTTIGDDHFRVVE